MSKNTSSPPDKPKLILAVDLGGSLTKVFYYDNSGNLKVLVMEPLTADVSEAELKNHLQQVVGNPEPEDVAWVKVADSSHISEGNGDSPPPDKPKVSYKFKAVGRLAKYFGGTASLRKAKFELGLFKILVAIGVTRLKLKLPPKLAVAVCILQPWGEYKNRNHLLEMLSDYSSFWFNGEKLSVSWWLFDFKPEGAGLGILRGKQVGASFRKRNTAVLMLGHRNSSILVFEKGVVQNGFTSDYGFIALVKRVHSRIPCYKLERLAETMIDAGYEPDAKILRRLVLTDSPALQAKEVEDALASIKDVRNQFARDVGRWVNETLADYAVHIDEIVVGGGAADYLKSAMEPLLNVPSVWDIQNLPVNIASEGVGTRLLDVYGMATFLRDKVDRLAIERQEQQLYQQQKQQKLKQKQQQVDEEVAVGD